MTPEQLFVYTEETYIHTELAISNYITFQNLVGDPASRQRREAWMFLQSFLSHFGMVSKLLFAPSARKDASKQRALELQKHLETDEKSPLNDRDARNAIEHIDERLDNWLDAGDCGILECVFESRKDLEYLDPKRWMIRRVFIVSEQVLITQEASGRKETPLESIVSELYRLLDLCSKKLNGDDTYTMPTHGLTTP
jgi:hypothetical protein